jgi:glycosyltransferase involved in cell wall biosynthesis
VQAFRQKYGLMADERIIGIAARLATEMGVEFLAEALPQVLEKFPTARVLFAGPYQNIVGEEEYAQRLAPLIERLGRHWTFLGILADSEFSAFFHACELTVLPSINSTESYGLVQVESMMCGTPVVASDLPGVRVPVRLTGMGKIVPPMDAQKLANAIIAILEDPRQFSGEPDAVVRRSTPAVVAAEYEQVFEQAIELAGQRNAETYV